MSSLVKLFQRLTVSSPVIKTVQHGINFTQVRFRSKPNINTKPLPGVNGKAYRRIVHFPEEYTIEPLATTHLAGRDPVSGRVVAKGIGGGLKHKYHWIKWVRDGPEDGSPRAEKVIQIMKCGCRTAHIALVGVDDELKYILATENMKAGDIIKTSRHLSRIPVRANEGDAYPLGSLPIGTIVHCIEKYPGGGGLYVHAAGTFGTILRKQDDKIYVKMPSKHEFGFDQNCLATVGRLSNITHGSTPIGSHQNNRLLGNRPRSGLWHRKDGRHGRKIKPPKKMIVTHTIKHIIKPYKLTLHI